MSVSPYEQSSQSPDTLAELQAGREYAARQAAESRLLDAFDSSRLINRRFTLGAIDRNWGSLQDQMITDASLLMSLDTLGIDSRELYMTSLGSFRGDEIAAKDLGPETLRIYAYKKGLSFRIQTTTESDDQRVQTPSDIIRTALHSRLMESPAHQALIKADEQLRVSDEIPEQVRTEPFDYTKDPLASMVFFDDIGLTSVDGNTFVDDITAENATYSQLLDGVLAKTVKNRERMVWQKDGVTTIFWQDNQSVPLRKSVELYQDGTCVYGAQQLPINAYLERANQSTESLSLPFIETQAAHELTRALEQAGLMFHPSIQYEMMDVSESDRYGSIYSQIGRQVAKWVNDPVSLKLSKLFVPYDAAYSGLALAKQDKRNVLPEYEIYDTEAEEAREDEVRTAYTSMTHSEGSEASTTLFDMIDDVLAVEHDPSLQTTTDITVTNDRISMKDGACFDVAAYYVGAAANMPYGEKGLKRVRASEDSTVIMLEKTTGVSTFLTTNPIRFNGVRLPKGSLFHHAKDGGWAFLRLTPFAFDEATDQLAFGSEMTKMFTNEKAALRRIGDITLSRLIEFA